MAAEHIESSLTVVFDNTVAPHLMLSIGGDAPYRMEWTRITIFTTKKIVMEQLSTVIPRVISMVGDIIKLPTILINGPDCPAQTADVVKSTIIRIWNSELQPAAANPIANPIANTIENRSRIKSPIDSRNEIRNEIRNDNPIENKDHKYKRVDEQIVAQMVQTVQSYVEEFGAAPNFSAQQYRIREKVYNYIRSVTAMPRANDATVEQVRMRLAIST